MTSSAPPLRLAVADHPLGRARAQVVREALQRADARALGVADESLVADAPSTAGEIEIVPLAGGPDDIRRFVRQGRAEVALLAFSDLPAATEPVAVDAPGSADPLERASPPRSSSEPGPATAPGLRLAAVPPRDDPREALVSREGRAFTYLPQGSRFGVARALHRSQLLRRRGDLELREIPEQLEGAVRLLEQGAIDAFVAGAADLRLAGHGERIAEHIDTRQMLPCAGQGALALEVRVTDHTSATRLAALHDAPSAFAVLAERSCLQRLGIGRTDDAPVGVYAVTDGEQMFIHGYVGSLDGRDATKLRWQGPMREAREVGATLAELLLAAGADRLLPGAAPPPRWNVEPRR